ncbi:MAG: tetratricopeptide repeat protein [Candidatus Riflebacteria bacterium]|nr:tetratricopeptide repeat protein [Candidatus Riflebacteria bacterium]
MKSSILDSFRVFHLTFLVRHSLFNRLLLGFVILPLCFLCILEIGLRYSSYGYPSEMFIEHNSDQGPMVVINQQAGRRFFPPNMARRPLPEVFHATKDSTGALGGLAYRIFVIGESAARGEHLADFSFSRMLRAMLCERYPGRRFEVINTGIPAVNSWVMRELVRESTKYQPDLYIFYGGHNEIIGPYGPGTVFTSLHRNSLINAKMALSGLKLTQLSESILHYLGISPSETSTGWKGLEMFMNKRLSANDPARDDCAAAYEANCREMFRLAKAAGAKFIACKAPVNLRDCPPFASVHRTDLERAQLQDWEHAFQEGISQQASQHSKEALEAFDRAAEIDSGYAELQFRRAECLAALGRSSEAKESYKCSCEFDALCFRVTERFNAALSRTAESEPNVRLVDIVKDFSDAENDGIPGREMFYDHVHLTVPGHYRVASSLLREIEKGGWIGTPEGKALDQAEVLARLGFTQLDEEHNLEMIVQALQKPPFTSQYRHSERIAGWRSAKNNLADTHESRLSRAIEAYAGALEQDPQNVDIYVRMSLSLQEAGRLPEALEMVKRALKLNPFHVEALSNQGLVHYASGDLDNAVIDDLAALSLAPNFVGVRFNLAIVLGKLGKVKEAVDECLNVIRQDPLHVRAFIERGILLSRKGDLEGAISDFQAATVADPEIEDAWVNLGSAMIRQEKAPDAYSRLENAARTHPEWAMVCLVRANALLRMREPARAIAGLKEAASLAPENVTILKRAAQILATVPDPVLRDGEVASALALRAVKLTGGKDALAYQILAAAEAARGQLTSAVHAAETGLQMASTQGNSELAAQIRENLSLYQSQM